MLEYALYWLIATNSAGFILMVWDKWQAERGGWRIAERDLITLSFVGGSLGTLAGSILTRHKTRKQPIASYLRAIPMLHIALGIAIASAAALGLLEFAAQPA